MHDIQDPSWQQRQRHLCFAFWAFWLQISAGCTSYLNALMLHSFPCCPLARSDRTRPIRPFWFSRLSDESQAPHHENTGSIPVQSTADLWQTKLHLDRFLFQHLGLPYSTTGHPLSVCSSSVCTSLTP